MRRVFARIKQYGIRKRTHQLHPDDPQLAASRRAPDCDLFRATFATRLWRCILQRQPASRPILYKKVCMAIENIYIYIYCLHVRIALYIQHDECFSLFVPSWRILSLLVVPLAWFDCVHFWGLARPKLNWKHTCVIKFDRDRRTRILMETQATTHWWWWPPTKCSFTHIRVYARLRALYMV